MTTKHTLPILANLIYIETCMRRSTFRHRALPGAKIFTIYSNIEDCTDFLNNMIESNSFELGNPENIYAKDFFSDEFSELNPGYHVPLLLKAVKDSVNQKDVPVYYMDNLKKLVNSLNQLYS